MSIEIDTSDPIYSLVVPKKFDNFLNFGEILRWRAKEHPDSIAFTFLPDGEVEEENITFAELDRYVRTVAADISKRVAPGSRALLIFDSGIDYIAAIVACFYTGVIAVPVYPPEPMRFQTTMERLSSIVRDCQASIILTTEGFSQWADDLADGKSSIQCTICSEQIDRTQDIPFEPVLLDPGTTALLQYTSGSTGVPKGVIVSHGNLFANARHVQQFDQPHAKCVSWLPMYHDMGLMGTVLQALHSGRQLVLMSPLRFVERPVRWLRAISRYRAYATSGPNFAYELCVRKIPESDLEDLDLSCLTLAVTGAEPVCHDTLDQFAKRFAKCGFKREAFYPSYGLAEATLIVSGGEKHEPPVVKVYDHEMNGNGTDVPPRKIVGCGKPIEDSTVRIVDPESHRVVEDGQVGEIWFAGPNVARGYWNRTDETKRTFGVFTADSLEGPFLRTGDLGFIEENELFPAGRIKDLIIIRGRNHYPHDIEQTVRSSHAALQRNIGVAFSILVDGEEKLVFAQEVRRSKHLNKDEILDTVRGAIMHEHQVMPHIVILVSGGSIPKTSSGKIRRSPLKTLFLNDQLSVIARWDVDTARAKVTDASHPETGHAVKSRRLDDVTVRANGSSRLKPANGKPKQISRTVAAALKTNSNGDHKSPSSTKRNGHHLKQEVFHVLSNLLIQLKKRLNKNEITLDSFLFAELGLESIDAVSLLADVESHYQRRFSFNEFFAEIGQRHARDLTLRELVDFVGCELAQSAENSKPKESSRNGENSKPVEFDSFVTTRGLKFFYRQDGESGPDVVLLHGIGGNLTGWYLCGLVHELAKRFRVTTYDMRGHGKSDVPDSGYTSLDMANDLEGILSLLGIEKALLFGHSYGATVALHTAVKFPKRVSGIVLSDAYLPGLRHVHGELVGWLGWDRYQALARDVGLDVSEHWDNLAPLFQQISQLSPKMQRRFIDLADESTLHRLARLATTTCGKDVKKVAGLTAEKIASVKHRVVCLYGDRSPFRPLCDYLESSLTNCGTMIVPNAEHFGFDENPEEYVRLSVASLANLAGIDATVSDSPIRRFRGRLDTVFSNDHAQPLDTDGS